MKWRAAVDRAVVPLGLTHAQFSVLASLYGMQSIGQRPSQRRLADFTGLEALYVSKLARTLERAGLIERTADPVDTRAVQLALTDRGLDVAMRAVVVVHDLQEQLTASLGGAGSARTKALMRDVQALLAAPGPTESQGEVAMPNAPTLTGQDIGQAEKATRAVLDALLADTGLAFEQWVGLNLLATSGDALDVDEIVKRMTAGLKIDDTAVHATLDELTERRLVTATTGVAAHVELTGDGRAVYQRVRTEVDHVTERLYGDLPTDDLVIARRVLAIVTERANAELARDR
jgi:DNA-binding MarR family transcriptional regulator